MAIRSRNIILAVMFVLVAALVSIPLAVKSEGSALQLGMFHGTPGLYIAEKIIAGHPPGEDTLTRLLIIAISVDARLWFFLICGGAGLVVYVKRRNLKST